jgi:hypothetical protein
MIDENRKVNKMSGRVGERIVAYVLILSTEYLTE